MFEDWETNMETYLKLKNYIEKIFLYIVQESSPYFIIPFFNNFYDNGFEIMDGNPIFSAKFEKKSSIIKIVIDDGMSNEQYFNSIFNNMNLFTIIIPIKKIHGLEKLIKYWFQTLKL